MTRDQANQIVNSIWNKPYKYPPSPTSKTNWLVECLEALGVLSLEDYEPTAYAIVHCLAGQLVTIESNYGTNGDVAKLHSSAGVSILEALDRSGFKVVRK